jgi:enolase
VVRGIHAREILDSRGQPTLEVAITVGGETATASVPSGKSTGRFEALERRDHDSRRFNGKGVLGAVGSVNTEIAASLVGRPLPDRETLDQHLRDLDGTPNKSRLGANAILGVSLAAARIRARLDGVLLYESLGGPEAVLLPVPCFNVINGGAHAPNELDFQEFMLAPAGMDTYSDALRAGAETYHALARLLEENGLSTAVGDEGGFAPAIRHPIEALEWIVRAIEAAHYKPGEDIFIALDPAASGFFTRQRYRFAGSAYAASEMRDLYRDWLARFPILSIEDGLAEDDIEGWQQMTEFLGPRVQIVGDDIFVSDPARIRWAIENRIANAVLLKPNQIGTVSEIFETAAIAKEARYRLMMSHRSGETDDSFIADLAVALGTGQIKSGAPARGERLAKYNQLLRIEEALGSRARFAGVRAFRSGT